jgi:peptidoglycan/xylan/chitin deacetylase (PgdA/CDA1 family)
VLKNAKLQFLRTCERLGVSQAVLNSPWRRNHLLVLCYHGVSLEDEHEWNGSLYMTRELLRKRMQTLADCKCNVLKLDEAVRRLYAGTLPDRSVALTFDDGAYDFYKIGWPIVREFGYPATVYLTTYYSEYNRPVFDVMCSYILWKGQGCGRLDWPEVSSGPLDQAGRDSAVRKIKHFALSKRLSGRQKDNLLGELAARLRIDYELLCRKRILHIMTPDEVRQLAREGVDFQLHTHRHRVWRRREKLYSELDDNRARIIAASGAEPKHFCYTGGFYLPEFENYLEQYGILSATTCKPGLCATSSNRMFLPRLVDTSSLSSEEFRGWVSGVAEILPQRAYVMSEGQLAEEAEVF